MRRGIFLAVACACAALLRAHGVDLARAALPNGSFREGSVRQRRRTRGGDEDSPVSSVKGMYSPSNLQRRVRRQAGATATKQPCRTGCDSPTCTPVCDHGCNNLNDGKNGCDRGCDQPKCEKQIMGVYECNHSCECPACVAGQYRSGSCTGYISNSDGKVEPTLATCKPCKQAKDCAAGKFLFQNPSAFCGGDRDSTFCAECGNNCGSPNYYRSGTCGGTTDYECKLCSNTTCATGEYRSGSCSSTTKGFQCSTCAAGQYLKGSSPTARGTCTTCSNAACHTGTEYRSGSCSGTTDGYQCISQPSCSTGQYLKGSSPTARGTCTTCSNTACKTGTEYRSCSCSGTTNGYQCVALGSCPNGQYLSGHNSTSDGTCVSQSSCQGGEYLSGATGTQKGTCLPCTNANCQSHQYRTGACTGTTNGFQCANQPSCNDNHYLAGASTTTKRTCPPCTNTECQQGQYRSGTCDGTSNGFNCNQCSNIGCVKGAYRSGSCSGTTNGCTCEPQPTCTSKQYLSGASDTARGTCVDQPTCGSGKWCPACARQRVWVRIVYFACAAFCLCFVCNSKCIQRKGASTCNMVDD